MDRIPRKPEQQDEFETEGPAKGPKPPIMLSPRIPRVFMLSPAELEQLERDLTKMHGKLTDTLNEPEPLDFASSTILEKSNYIKNQIKSLCHVAPINRNSYLGEDELHTVSQSGEFKGLTHSDLAHTKLKGNAHDDLLKDILDPTIGSMNLSAQKKSHLASLIIGALRDSASDQMRQQMSELQSKHEAIDHRIAQNRAFCRQITDERQSMEETRDKLQSEVSILNDQVNNLEHQLEDSFTEIFMYEDLTEELKEELMQAREVISNTPIENRDATNYVKNLGRRKRNQDLEKYRQSARMSIAQGRFTSQARTTIDFRKSALFNPDRPSAVDDEDSRPGTFGDVVRPSNFTNSMSAIRPSVAFNLATVEEDEQPDDCVRTGPFRNADIRPSVTFKLDSPR